MTNFGIKIQLLIGALDHAQNAQINAEYLPDYWHDMQTDPFYSNTWRFTGLSHGHSVSMVNETAYVDEDTPFDYYFPYQEQWEPDAQTNEYLMSQQQINLGEPMGIAMMHHKVLPW